MNISSSVSSIATSMFSKLDTKKQGYLDKTDLEQAFAGIDSSSSSKSSSSTSDVDALFSQMDTDQDGKITESELTTSINSLVDQLNAQLNSKLGMSGGSMPPPPPSQGADDTGLTKDELTQIASTTDDTQLAGLMSKIAANFDAADTNQDGKVTSKEAMTYQSSTSSTSSSTGSSSSDSSSNSSSTDQQSLATLMKIAQLIQAYGFDSNNTSASAISTTA